ncbi:acyl-CoA dehydrogenase family protein [Almyronema epifaneia]|uniref:Acyl-CoA dehydrogenase family protein n=1 Tax=Almyronema epifaneia S1 TaxID=2991925 RepID=A0ABW6IFY2_9CYAN
MVKSQLAFQPPVKDYLAVARQVAQSLAETAVARDRSADLPHQEVRLLKESGLLLLPVPRHYGGVGATWPETYRALQTIAHAEGSTAQLYANHISLVALAEVMGRPGQAEFYYRLTAERNLFWANALNGRDARLHITPVDNHFRLNGVKSFGTGMAVADMRVIGAKQAGIDPPIVCVLPSDRDGIVYNDDWQNMGQRCTASGSYRFQNVFVQAEELMGPPPLPDSALPTLIFLIAQLAKTYTYLGLAEGALQAAKNYTATQTRPWIDAGVDRATHDPYILKHYGELWTQLQAAIALSDQAAAKVQAGWQQGLALTFEERGDIAIAVSAAKAFVTQVGLAICNRMFEVMGARATAAHYGYDRYWRDLRTFTLHDPVDYKFKAVGDWLLNGQYPLASQYS